MKQTVKLNYLRIAPRKVRAVAALIQGLPVTEAEAQLMVQRRRPARPILKLLRSAVAAAKSTKRLNPDQLYVESIRVDLGPRLKRILPRARGTATPIQKKMSHVTLILAEGVGVRPARFKIVVPKKVKLPPGEKPSARKKKVTAEKTETAKAKPAGFFRKIFRRKSV